MTSCESPAGRLRVKDKLTSFESRLKTSLNDKLRWWSSASISRDCLTSSKSQGERLPTVTSTSRV